MRHNYRTTRFLNDADRSRAVETWFEDENGGVRVVLWTPWNHTSGFGNNGQITFARHSLDNDRRRDWKATAGGACLFVGGLGAYQRVDYDVWNWQTRTRGKYVSGRCPCMNHLPRLPGCTTNIYTPYTPRLAEPTDWDVVERFVYPKMCVFGKSEWTKTGRGAMAVMLDWFEDEADAIHAMPAAYQLLQGWIDDAHVQTPR